MKSNLSFFKPLIIALALLMTYSIVFAIDYKITKVVEIGPADPVPFIEPLKWSPDGQWISYFCKGYLMLSDTLGKSHQVCKMDMMPWKYEWLSNKEIIIHSKISRNGQSHFKLSIIDISTGGENIIIDKTESWQDQVEKDLPSYDGPRRTIEGFVLYLTKNKKGIKAYLVAGKYGNSQESLNLNDNHIISWGKDGLYVVRTDFSDSIKIWGKTRPDSYFIPAIRPDNSYIFEEGIIVRLSDSTVINLDTVIRPYPPKTVFCDFACEAFNPKYPEVLFQINCDDGENYEILRSAVFNLATNNLTILDTIANKENCREPVYSPTGQMISFLSGGKAYVIHRGGR